ncbi:MAG: glycosyltransferase [Calothrix sp. C42_A2020_038]|nr:glycosyltransferase [Calothrix sp. C42_A2020_038]
MKKLLTVATVPITITGFLLPFAQHFRKRGWQMDAMSLETSAMPECVENFDNIWDVEFSRSPLDLQNLIVAPRQILQVLEKQEYDIVHVHTAIAAFVTRLALSRLKHKPKPKLVYTVHGFNFYRGNKFIKNLIFLALEKIAAPWTDYMVVINREDEEAAKHHRLISPERLYYMPGIGVDLNYYNSNQISTADIQQVRQELGLEPEDAMILASAEFNPRKRHQDMLRALAELGRSNVHLAFAGTGPLMEDMKTLAANLGIQKQVHFLGFRSDMPILMGASVATIMASEREGLARSVMESLCLEIPVIGADSRGIRDLLADGCGLIVPVGDIKGFAAAMAWVVDNPEAARETAKRGKERMVNYGVRHIIKLHESLYADVMQTPLVHC